MIYDDTASSFGSLLERGNSFSIHDWKVEQLAMEIYKVAYGLEWSSKSNINFFLAKNNMQTRSQSKFLLPQLNTVCFGQKSVRYLGHVIWNSLPLSLRNVDYFFEFTFLI